MTFVSYAQNLEDVMLWRALKHIDKGFYIDVGAAWHDVDSVTYAFYQRGWTGINIEPNPDFLRLLKKEREKDINLEVAISDYSSMNDAIFYLMSNQGLSSLNADIVETHKKNGLELSKITVETTTLATLCKKYLYPGQQVHFLKIDVEGLEKNVIKSNNWALYRPWIILVEATIPMTQIENYEEWEAFLVDEKYIFVYADGLNRFYVASEHSELIPAFKYPPNLFDGYELAKFNKKINELEKAVIHFQTQFQSISTSKSWAITKPLRITIESQRRFFNFLKNTTHFKFSNRMSQIARKIFIRVFQLMHKYPFVVKLISKFFSFFPSLKLRLRNMYFNSTIYSSRERTDSLKDIEINDLSDHAKNIYKQFIALESNKLDIRK